MVFICGVSLRVMLVMMEKQMLLPYPMLVHPIAHCIDIACCIKSVACCNVNCPLVSLALT